MNNFTHRIPTELRFGKDVVSGLPEVLDRYGKNVLLAYGGESIRRIGLYDRVTGLLSENGFRVTELSGIEPNPVIGTVRKGVRLCLDNGIDVILAVGGGSVIDCAKAVAAGRFWEGDLWDMVLQTRSGRKALPLVDILTVSATGSEFDENAVISNPDTKEKYGSLLAFPAVSFCDPTYTFSVPARQTAAGSADIMSHVMEGYFSRTDTSDVSDGFAEAILRAVIKNLPVALKHPDDYNARANLMWASSLGCSKMSEYGKTYPGKTCHAIGHELTAYYGVIHGESLAILTPRWMRMILAKDPSVAPRFARFARNVWDLEGEDEMDLALRGIEALASFFGSIGIPTTLSEVGVDDAHFREIAVHADLRGRCSKAYVPLYEEDVIQLLRDCM